MLPVPGVRQVDWESLAQDPQGVLYIGDCGNNNNDRRDLTIYRFDPRRIAAGEAPLKLDHGPIKAKVRDYMQNEGRFRMVGLADKERYERLVGVAERSVIERRALYDQLAGVHVNGSGDDKKGT